MPNKAHRPRRSRPCRSDRQKNLRAHSAPAPGSAQASDGTEDITRRPVPRALKALKPQPRNSRTHSKKQIQQIANSIRHFGWTCPILADENGFILAGHGRYYAAQQLGLHHVPVIVVAGLSGPEKRALILADNKIAANAGWDRAALAAELTDLAELLPEYELSLEITGFEAA